MKVAIVGLGHVGLVIAVCLADMMYEITGVDLRATIELLNQEKIGFFEPGLHKKLISHMREGRLHFTTQLEDTADSRVIWITIGAKQTTDQIVHVTEIERIVVKLAKLCSSETVIAVKSTMPVGACRYIAEQLPEDGPFLVYNPEFLRQGSAIQDFFHPSKIVLGCGPKGGMEPLLSIYQSFPCSPTCTNWETAEVIKLAQNALNAVHISFLNEITLMVEGVDASLELVSQVLRNDISTLQRYLYPGFSYGGACLLGNIAYLSNFGHSKGYSAPLLQAVATVNDLRMDYLVQAISRAVSGLKGRRIVLWGLTYKANTDDLCDSPSVFVVRRLLEAGALGAT